MNVNVALADRDSRVVFGQPEALRSPVVVRPATDTGLPWTLRVASADPDRELAALSGRRKVTLAGLALLGALVLAGGYLVERAVARDLAAARLQADFVATVSHEFRSPLTAMKHLLEMLEDGAVPGEERRQRYYHILSGEAERLRQLVENLLDFRRMEEGKVEYRLETLDAGEFVGQVTEEFAGRLPSRDRLVVSLDGRNARLKADREALARALRNLLDNSAKYSPEAAPIHVGLAVDGAQVLILGSRPRRGHPAGRAEGGLPEVLPRRGRRDVGREGDGDRPRHRLPHRPRTSRRDPAGDDTGKRMHVHHRVANGQAVSLGP